MEKKRIDWVDIAKGIAIILVIVGHCVANGEGRHELVRGIIFSFHMPLFFIMSLYTYKLSTNDAEFKQKTGKAFRHLIIPAILTYAIWTIWEISQDTGFIGSLSFWKDKLFTIIFASGVDLEYNGMTVTGIGIQWFFVALFLGRIIFDYMNLALKDDKKLLIVSSLCSFGGVLFGKEQWLPFSLDIALAIQLLFYFGYYLKRCPVEKNVLKKMLLSCALWFFTFYLTCPDLCSWTYMELAFRRYSLFPLCYVTAIAGTMLVSYVSICIDKLKILAVPLRYIGRNSMYLLCVHILDDIYMDFWMVEGRKFVTSVRRMAVDMAVFAVFMLIRSAVSKAKRSS